jgi:hypothetical protein
MIHVTANLTRARQRMIIYVPQPSRDDRSRLHDDLDATARFLVDCGATELGAEILDINRDAVPSYFASQK